MVKVRITRIDVSTGNVQELTDWIAQEKPLYVFLNRKHYATIFCSPSDAKELAVGHLLTEGMLKNVDEIDVVTLDEKKRVCRIRLKEDVDVEKRLRMSKNLSRVIFSACGTKRPYQPSQRLPKIKSNIKVSAEIVSNCVRQLNVLAETFRKTGGVHAAAIHRFDGAKVAFAEDVGRHNAVDKVIGIAALNRHDFGECLLCSTGRLTGDMVFKAATMGLPVVASLAAAIDSGITIAKGVDLTLVGFVRGKRMNIYSSPERIVP